MDISQSISNKTLIVTPTGRLDSNTSPDLENFFNDHADEDFSGIIVDMVELDYISSAGLRVILNISKLLKSKGDNFVICNLQDHIHEIFEISGFDLFVDITKSLQEALGHNADL